jgi:L-lysine 6-transaminase
MQATNVKAGEEMTAAEVLETLRTRILVDGFGFVADPQFSHDAYLHDAASGKDFLDFYAFFASQPISYNHPRMREPEFQARLLTAATTKVANSDCYTRFYAEFVRTLDEIAAPPGFEHFFFIDGGALGIENALKAAFDWKVRKNLAAGRGELGTQVIHFRRAFHGRTGYTMSLTNTDPNKTQYFPKFNWPRIDHPYIDFTLAEPQRSQDVAAREQQAIAQIEAAVAANPHDIAALIIEPIQGEGGDNHFRAEFFRSLRSLADRHDFILIFDEVQCGVGITGKMWGHQHFGVVPDMICFGKKMQVCGLMSNTRVDEVDSVFKVSSRINSTWGGNLADMVRATQYLRVIDDENLVERAAETGQYLLEGLQRLAAQHPIVTAVRGRGLMCAFDLPDAETRNSLRRACYDRQMLVLGCGERSIRFRPMLDVDSTDIDRGLETLDEALCGIERAKA